MNLKPCPCGQTPTALLIQEELSPLPLLKYARCTGNCCAEWEIEFRNDYKKGDEAMKRAIQAWNDAPRGDFILDWKLAKESKPKQGERVLLKINNENCTVVGYWGCGCWEVCTVNLADGDDIIERAFNDNDVTHYAHIGYLPNDL